jgi:hypothetical protein
VEPITWNATLVSAHHHHKIVPAFCFPCTNEPFILEILSCSSELVNSLMEGELVKLRPLPYLHNTLVHVLLAFVDVRYSTTYWVSVHPSTTNFLFTDKCKTYDKYSTTNNIMDTTIQRTLSLLHRTMTLLDFSCRFMGTKTLKTCFTMHDSIIRIKAAICVSWYTGERSKCLQSHAGRICRNVQGAYTSLGFKNLREQKYHEIMSEWIFTHHIGSWLILKYKNRSKPIA